MVIRECHPKRMRLHPCKTLLGLVPRRSRNDAIFNNSPIFDPVTGFEGNGISPSLDPWPWVPAPAGVVQGSCIFDGPFANHNVSLGPGYNLSVANSRCLRRSFQKQAVDEGLGWSKVLPALKATDFTGFTYAVGRLGGKNLTVHAIGHLGVSGEVNSPSSFLTGVLSLRPLLCARGISK